MSGSTWQMSDGGNRWVFGEGGNVPAVADPIRMTAGDTRYLTADFGNLREFRDDSVGIDSEAEMLIAIEPESGIEVSEITPTGYSVSAWLSAGNAGDYTVSVTVTLTDGTVITRRGALILE